MEGAKRLSIVQIHEDYSSIIVASVPGADQELPWLSMIKTSLTHFLLVWDWGSPSNLDLTRGFQHCQASIHESPASEASLKACIGEATRLFDVAVMLRIAARHDEEVCKISAASRVCSRGLKDWKDTIMVEGLSALLLRDEGDWIPLYGLAACGHIDILEWFIIAGKLCPGKHGDMLLWCAVQGGQRAVAQLLFDRGVSFVWQYLSRAVGQWGGFIFGSHGSGLKPLSYPITKAPHQLHRSMVEFLLDAKIISLTAALLWSAESDRLRYFRLAIWDTKGFSARHAPAWWGALMQAAQEGRHTAVQALVKDYMNRVSLPFTYKKMLQVTEQLVRAGHRPIVRHLISFLIERRPDRLFAGAAAGGFEATVKAMFEKDYAVSWNFPDPLFDFGLSAAVDNGHVEVVRAIIVEKGKTSVNVVDRHRRTPLHRAVLRKQTAMVELLVRTGKAKLKMKDADGKTAVQLAAEGGDEEIYELVSDVGKGLWRR